MHSCPSQGRHSQETNQQHLPLAPRAQMHRQRDLPRPPQDPVDSPQREHRHHDGHHQDRNRHEDNVDKEVLVGWQKGARVTQVMGAVVSQDVLGPVNGAVEGALGVVQETMRDAGYVFAVSGNWNGSLEFS